MNEYGSTEILIGDCRRTMTELPAGSVHACITSPPYWGLRDYKAGEAMIGLEPTPEAHIENLLAVFREVRRVLRDDGTLWLNYGDAYAGTGKSGGGSQGEKWDDHGNPTHVGNNGGRWSSPAVGYQAGDLMMLPHRVAMALQADRWIVRSAIVWAKALSFCPTYSGSCMPESLGSTRWEKCRVKVSNGSRNQTIGGNRDRQLSDDVREPHLATADQAQWSPCPGCARCEPNGGYVLRRGSWRPTAAHEFVFQLAKGPGYYCDGQAVKEKNETYDALRRAHLYKTPSPKERLREADGMQPGLSGGYAGSRNLRNVWTINPQPFPDAHFATFPEKLIEPIVKVSTSQRGVCPECGAPWARVMSVRPSAADAPTSYRAVTEHSIEARPNDGIASTMGGGQARQDWLNENAPKTLGWRPTCGCGGGKSHGTVRLGFDHHGAERIGVKVHPDPIPATILDPFGGSGTTGMVANQHGRDAIICELNEEYAAMAKQRIGKALRPNTYRDDSIVAEVDGGLFQ